jgi:hypothetical protein
VLYGVGKVATQYPNHPIKLMYTNYKGETEERHVVPLCIRHDISQWHGGGSAVWLLDVWDLDKESEREYELAKCNFDY